MMFSLRVIVVLLTAIGSFGVSNPSCDFCWYTPQGKSSKCVCSKNYRCLIGHGGCFANCATIAMYYHSLAYHCVCSNWCHPNITVNTNCASITQAQNRCFLPINNTLCGAPNVCAIDLCKNGVCRVKPRGFSCDCNPGYIGEDCEIDADHCRSIPCKNGGSCNNLAKSYKCACPGNYTGPNCEDQLCACDCRFKTRLEILKKVNSEPLDKLKQEWQPYLTYLKHELLVDKHNTTSAKRKKISAPDNRKSAQQLGIVGAAFLAIVFGLFVMNDILSFKMHIASFRHFFNKPD